MPRHTADEERKVREAALDETIEASFPASDPPSSNPNPADYTAADRFSPSHGFRSDVASRRSSTTVPFHKGMPAR